LHGVTTVPEPGSCGIEDLELLRCPRTRQTLRWDGALVAGGQRYEVTQLAGRSYADLRAADERDAVRGLQLSVYESADNRHFQQGGAEQAAFMQEFVTRRVRGRVRGKDRLFREGFAQLRLPRGGRVLELGCNDGRFLNWVCTQYGCRGLGIDLSRLAIEKALRGNDGRFDTAFHLADSTALPFCDGAFDAIIALDVFEHLGHPAFADPMRECARVLKPGGGLAAFVVSQKVRFTFHETLRVMTHDRMGVDVGEGHEFQNFIAPDHFRCDARAAGLRVDSLRAYHGFWTLYAEEALGLPLPDRAIRVLEWLDRPLTRSEFGNGYLAIAVNPR
jgi:SAM-dependent methyltransferase